MPRSPVPLREILEYLTLEDVEGLVPGSVRYVGPAVVDGETRHYWSFPLAGHLHWACLGGGGLFDTDTVPESIRAATAALDQHRVRRAAASTTSPTREGWTGSNLSSQDLPRWVPASQVRVHPSAYEAVFPFDFDRAAAAFGATPSRETVKGIGPRRFFFLELARHRIAMLECEQRFPNHINLYLPEDDLQAMLQGIAYWDDYDQVMDPLGVPLEGAFRQGGVVWKHRDPTPEALERKRHHERRMWLPPN